MRWCPIKSSSICRVDSVGLLPGKALIPHYIGSFSKEKKPSWSFAWEGAHTISSLVAFSREKNQFGLLPREGAHTISLVAFPREKKRGVIVPFRR